MPDNFKKDTSIEDEIEKSLQKMVEEETTVAKALVGKNDLPSNMKTADINDGKTRVIPQITDEILREQKNDYSAKNGEQEDVMEDDELLLGNVGRGYVMNINENVTLYQEDHVKARATDYMTYAIVDGDVLTTKAFALLKKQ